MHIFRGMKVGVIDTALFFISLLIIFGFIGSVSAATITVNSGQIIQSAINSANDGDVIIVDDGNYYGNVVVNKKISLIANGNVNLIALNSRNPVITVTTSGTVIKNFKLSNSIVGVQYFGSVSNNQLINNLIEGTGTSYGNGISFSNGLATNNLVQGNIISNVLHGILFNEGNVDNVVDSNNVTLGKDGAGIYSIGGSSGMNITNNHVSNGQDGIACESSSGVGDSFTIFGNTLTNSVNGFWMKLSNSILAYNTVIGCSVSGIDVSGFNNRIVNNIAKSNHVVAIMVSKYGTSDNAVISGNVIINNNAGINTNSTGVSIKNNYVWNNGIGIISTGGGAVISSNNVGGNSPNYIVDGLSNTQSNPISQENPIPVIINPK